jgi:iron complex outermembrane receptor protein
MRIILIIALLIGSSMQGTLLAADNDDIVEITAADLDRTNAADAAELLNRIPGVKASESSVSIRGSSNVKVLLDGRPINDPTSHSGSVKWSMISLSDIEKIEVHKGRGSVSYGDNTEGGVIVITSRKASRIGGTAGIGAGNNGGKHADISLQGHSDRFAANLTGGAKGYDGFTVNDDKSEYRAGLRLDFTPAQGRSLFLSGNYTTQEKGMRGYPGSRTPNARTEYDDYSLLFGLSLNSLNGRSWFRKTSTQNSDTDKDFFSGFDALSAGMSVERPVTLPVVGPVKAGFGYEWQEASGSGFSAKEEQRGWLHFTRLFRQQDGPWSADIGIRGNIYSTFTNTLNPEAKVSWTKKPLRVELTAGMTNNLPTFRQRYNRTSTTSPNPDLGMEKALNTGCSFSFAPTEQLSAEVSFFHRDITDRITYVRAADNTGRYENFGEVIYQGAEASLTWKPASWIELTPSCMYLHARNEETGLWLPAVPFHTASGELLLKPFGSLSIRTDMKYTGKVFARTDNADTIEGYLVANLRVDYRTGAARFHIDIDNLFDRQYLYADGYDAPPLEWQIGMNYTF